jgi:hypothetical protein
MAYSLHNKHTMLTLIPRVLNFIFVFIIGLNIFAQSRAETAFCAKQLTALEGVGEWPEGEALVFSELVQAVRKTIAQAYDFQRVNPEKSIDWKGPSTPQAVLTGGLGFPERLKAERLQSYERDQGRDAMDTIIGIFLQMGIENGRRTFYKGSAYRLALDAIQRAKLQLSNPKSSLDGIIANLDEALRSLKDISLARKIAGAEKSYFRTDGKDGLIYEWPGQDFPVVVDDMVKAIRLAFQAAYNFKPIYNTTNIQWMGPVISDDLFGYGKYGVAYWLSAQERSRHLKVGRNPLDQILYVAHAAALEQGIRTEMFQNPRVEWLRLRIGMTKHSLELAKKNKKNREDLRNIALSNLSELK